MYKLNCVICNERYISPIKTGLTCSVECRHEYKLVHNKEYNKSKKPQNEIFDEKCLNCKIDISQRLKKSQRLCSDQCRKEYKKLTRKTEHKICPTCFTEFDSCVKDKIYCQNKCKPQTKISDTIKNCIHCDTKFAPRVPHEVLCGSLECKRKQQIINSDRYNYKNKVRFDEKCLNCKTDISLRKDKRIRYCSKDCKLKQRKEVGNKIFIIKSCPICNKNFQTKNKSRRFCSRFCGKLQYKNIGPVIKDCKECKKEFITKYYIRHKSSFCSRSCRTIHSNRKRLFDLEGIPIPGGKYKQGVYYSIKLNKSITYDSSWEYSFLQQLDRDENVLTYKSQPFFIPYFHERKRNYVPDLLITYENDVKKLIEIKPCSLLNTEINQKKIEAAKKYCQENNYILEIWTENNNPYFTKQQLTEVSNNFSKQKLDIVD